MATARGATLLGPDKLEIREYPIPEIPPDGGLVKVEKGGVCGNGAGCRRGSARFCRQRTNYGGRTKCDKPPHLFGGFADYVYLATDVLATKASDALPADAAALIWLVI